MLDDKKVFISHCDHSNSPSSTKLTKAEGWTVHNWLRSFGNTPSINFSSHKVTSFLQSWLIFVFQALSSLLPYAINVGQKEGVFTFNCAIDRFFRHHTKWQLEFVALQNDTFRDSLTLKVLLLLNSLDIATKVLSQSHLVSQFFSTSKALVVKVFSCHIFNLCRLPYPWQERIGI